MSNVRIGIVMGSDSDLPVMQAAAQILDELGVEYEVTVVSAHRTPERLFKYAKEAQGRGIETIIAGAGGAAHLPGMLAAITELPVIGVPVKTSTLSGVDSLYSIVQMPRGVPVATVAINNAKNAGILAAQILGVKYPEVQQAVRKMKDDAVEMVEGVAASLEEKGWEQYLKDSGKTSKEV